MTRSTRYHHEPSCRPLVIAGGRRYGVCTCSDEFVADDMRRMVRAEGCTCDVELEVSRLANGDHHVKIGHDDWCPRLRAVRAVNN